MPGTRTARSWRSADAHQDDRAGGCSGSRLGPYSKKHPNRTGLGSVAHNEERSRSDVDVMVIGSLALSRLTPALSKAEKQLRRPVNATILSPRDFAVKIRSQCHFLHTVLVGPKIFLQGTSDDLERIAREANRRSPQDR